MNYKILIASLALVMTACTKPRTVVVPSTQPPMTEPPAEIMEQCPTAEREGMGEGVVPDLSMFPAPGTRASVIKAVGLTARYLRECDLRNQALRRHIREYISEQNNE